MRDLKHLMDEATDQAPSHGVDLGTVLETGRRRVRRRRTGTVLGAAGLVAAVTAGAALGSALDGGERTAPADEPNPGGRVLTLADAQLARAGEEYTVLSTQNTTDPGRDNPVAYREVLEDGSVVFEDGPSIRTGKYAAGTIDARAGETTWELALSEGDGVTPGDYVGTSDRWMVWAQSSTGLQARPGFLVLDRETGEHSTIDLLDGPAPSLGLSSFDVVQRAELGPDDRVYFTTAENEVADLLSVSLPDGASPRRELAVGEWDLDGDVLTYSEQPHRPTGTLRQRDLGSGEESTFEPGPATSTARGYRQDPCSLWDLRRDGDLVALQEFCRGPESRQVRVVEATSGDTVATLRGDVLEMGTLTQRYLTFAEVAQPHRGVYVYDLRTRDLWQASSDAPSDDPSLRGHGDLLTWATRDPEDPGTKLWIVDFGS